MTKKKTTPDSSIDQAIADIEEKYGEGSIMRLDKSRITEVEGIKTGSLALDIALGGKGIPRGRVCEIYGTESSGKTTLALSVIANAQKAGGVAAFVDVEHALDITWAKKIGVNVSEMLVSQPDTGEEALGIVEMLIKSNAVDIIVVDSVAALVPAVELQGEMGQSHIGLQARLMSQALRKLTGVINKSKTCLIFINQIRMKIGVMFGNPETTSGGKALKFYSSVRIDLRRIATIKDSEGVAVANRVRARVVKNKVAAPFRTAEFDLDFKNGISSEGSILDLGIEEGLIKRSGSWFYYGGLKLGQGREKVKAFLKENPELVKEIEEKIK